MKKIVSSILGTLTLSLMILAPQVEATELYHNTTKTTLSAPMLVSPSKDNVMIPAGEVAAILGIQYDYQPVTKTITFKKALQTDIFFLDRNYYSQNGKNVTITMIPKIQNNYIYIPLKELATDFGVKLEYNASTDQFTIKDDNWDYQESVQWEKNLSKISAGNMTKVSDGILVPYGNKLAKLDLQGKEIWTLTLGLEGIVPEEDQFVGTPVIGRDNFIYVTTNDVKINGNFIRYLYKISPAGEIVWKTAHATNFEGDNKPFEVTTDNKYIYLTQKNMVQCYEQSGKKRWQYQSKGYLKTKTIAINNKLNTHRNYSIFLDVRPNAIYKLDDKGNVLWKNSLVNVGTPNSFTYDDATGYAFATQDSSDGRTTLSLYDVMQEEWQWNLTIDGQLVGEPIFKDGNILVATTKYIIDLDYKGNYKWKLPFNQLTSVGWGTEQLTAVSVDGQLFSINYQGQILQEKALKEQAQQLLELISNRWLVLTPQKKILSIF